MNKYGDITYRGSVKSEWLDHNNHMNSGYYLVLFDYGAEALYRRLEVGAASREKIGQSIFALEARVKYKSELRCDDSFHLQTRLLGYDHNKLHYMQWVISDSSEEMCAINEFIVVNVDMKTRKSIPFLPETLKKLAYLADEHKKYGVSTEAGSSIKQIGFPQYTH